VFLESQAFILEALQEVMALQAVDLEDQAVQVDLGDLLAVLEAFLPTVKVTQCIETQGVQVALLVEDSLPVVEALRVAVPPLQVQLEVGFLMSL
jgi:hypothetical protein